MNMSAQQRSSLVPEMLLEYGEIVREALRGYLPQKEPRRYLYDLIADYPFRGGKMMRPALCIASACAFGARIEEAVKSAVAIELMHNALLVPRRYRGRERRASRPPPAACAAWNSARNQRG